MTASSSFEDPYLQNLLENIAREEGFENPKFSIKWGSKPGDNYCGRIYRAVITEKDESKTKSLSLIFKVSPLSKARQESTKTDLTFQTETDTYQTVLPTLNKLLNKYGVIKSDIFPGTVRCFKTELQNDVKVLILEDKSTQGFNLADSKSLDAEHCRLILEKIALWHASSLALQHHEPETAESFTKLITKPTVFTDAKGTVMTELKRSAYKALSLLQEPCSKGSKAYEKIENLVHNFENEMVTANEAPSDLSAILHGDCWFSNVLYKYNQDGSLQDVCLIDFQGTRFASPAVDLSYMLFMCTTKEVRDAHYDKLIRYYHDEVSSMLKKMDCDPEKIFPWSLLQKHLKKYARMGVLIAFGCLQICLVDSSDNNVNLESGDDDEVVFAGRANTSDPKKQREIEERTTDVITDALWLGYI